MQSEPDTSLGAAHCCSGHAPEARTSDPSGCTWATPANSLFFSPQSVPRAIHRFGLLGCTALLLLTLGGCSSAPLWDDPEHFTESHSVLERHGHVMAARSPAERRVALQHAAAAHRSARSSVVVGSYGTYGNPPRRADGTKDLGQLVNELVDLGVNTYDYLIYHDKTDWDDLKALLPMARQKNIQVWITVMPPSGSYPHRGKYSEPFRLEFLRWAEEIARLSLDQPNLVAWSIDDFTSDLKTFTPEYVKQIRRAAAVINPKLAFVPVVYFRPVHREFARDYGPLMDGILFPYRAESGAHQRGHHYNVTDASYLEPEVRRLKDLLGALPIVLFVYASRLSDLPEATEDYTARCMTTGHQLCDGVHVFRHPSAGSDKYALEKKLFHRWAGQAKERSNR